jgi:hypothetical protein
MQTVVRKSRSWTASEIAFLVLAGLAFVFELYVLFFPRKASFTRYPLAIPDVFSDIPPVRMLALPLLFIAGLLVLRWAVARWGSLVARPSLGVAFVFVFGIAVQVAMIASLRDGSTAFYRRAILSGHSEFIYEGVRVRNLRATLNDYEQYVPPKVYLSAKGPGVLMFFYGSRVLANTAPLKPVTAMVAPDMPTLRAWMVERNQPFEESQIQELQHLLGLLFLLYPVLTCVPVFFMYLLGRTFVDVSFGLLAALFYVFVPVMMLSVAHLDFAVFPALTTGVLAFFALGVSTRKALYVTLSALAFTVYLGITLAASALIGFLVPYAALAMLQRVRTEPLRRLTTEMLKLALIYVVIVVAVLGAFSYALDFNFFKRYAYARQLQRDWVTTEYNWFWVKTNLLGWFLSFGLLQSVLLVVQQGRSAWSLVRGKADGVDLVTLSWLFLMIGLVGLGRQHGETNRLWAFMAPLGCVIAARLMYDSSGARRYLPALAMLLAGLVLARYRLSFF